MANRLPLMLFAVLLTPWSCASASGGWESLPSSEQRLFERCQNAVTLQECPPMPGAVDEQECISASRAVYGGLSGSVDRRRWLSTHGCSRTVMGTPSP